MSEKLLSTFGGRQVNIAALSGRRLQAIPPGQRQIGRDWVPPMAALSFVDRAKVSMGHAQKLAAAGASAALPKSFSWANAGDISKAGKGKQVIGSVRNQLTCGSCWAVASATALGQRWSIAKQQVIELSESYLLACQSGGQSQQCNGGMTLEAGQFFEEKGVCTLDCQPYTWCSNQAQCSQQGQGEPAGGSNSFIPQCSEGCFECPNGGPNCTKSDKTLKLYKAKKGTTQQLITIEDIKAEIYANGPVVGAYAVMNDFLIEGANNFAKTGGVYINRQEQDSPYGDKAAASQIGGFHAVVIVGWGEQDVEGFGRVPYWVVQNSWGDAWGDKGFWKHAMTDKAKDINWKVGLDIPAKFDFGDGNQYDIGGATTFMPDTVYDAVDNGGDNDSAKSNGVDANDDVSNVETSTDMSNSTKKLGVTILFAVIATLLLVTLIVQFIARYVL